MLRLFGISGNPVLSAAIGAALLGIGIATSRPILMVIGAGIAVISVAGALTRGRRGDSDPSRR